jgi:hypothetical protein
MKGWRHSAATQQEMQVRIMIHPKRVSTQAKRISKWFNQT